MKKFLITLLCASVFLFTDFTSVEIDAYSKNENISAKKIVKEIKDSIEVNIEDAIKEQERLEEEQRKAENSNIVQTSSGDEYDYSYSSTETFGTYGRLYLSGFDVALYDYNVNTYSDLSLQNIVDNWDSAAYYTSANKLVIADHDTQGFSALIYLSEGDTAYIKFEDGSTIWYRLIMKAKGYNTGPDLVDTENNSFYNMDSDLIMYTCYDGGIMVTLWVLS